MQIALKADTKRLADKFARLQAAVADLTPVLDEIGQTLVTSVNMRFARGTGPDGEAWAPLTTGETPILVKSGRLRDSITHAVTGDSVTVGTNLLYAATHQFGATIKPKNAKALAFTVGGKFVMAKTVQIPARPFLGISDQDVDLVEGVIDDRLAAAFGAAP